MIKSLALFLFCILITIIWYISPIMKPFSKLSGKYQVGSNVLYFIDRKRLETFSEKSDDKRIIVGHIFFPIDNISNLKKMRYLGDKMPVFQKIFSKHYSIPKWLTKIFFRNILTNTYLNGSISQTKSKYPVILFSHGLLGLPSDMYLTLLENLANHGYIAIGIDHSYLNLITIHPNGEIISSENLAKKFEKMSPDEQKEFQNEAIDIYKDDIKFVLDELEKINWDKNSQFYDRLDLKNICVMGHSAGGTASIEVCRGDNRCKAAIDLDGWYDQVIGHEPLTQPLLLLFGSKSIEVNEPTLKYLERKQLTREQYFEREKKIADHRKELCSVPQCLLQILPNISHGDFGDEVLLKWPLRSWNEPASYETILVINEAIVEFLNKHLENEK